MADLTKELIITKHPAEVQIALLENKRLVELHQEKSTEQFSVGNIYVGKVRKIMPGLNAAFVNIGCDKDAFLHYLDIGPNTLTLNDFVAADDRVEKVILPLRDGLAIIRKKD